MKPPNQLAKQIERLTTLTVTEVYETDDPTIEDDSITIQDGEITWDIQICAMDNGRLCLGQWKEDRQSHWSSKTYDHLPALFKNELPQYLRKGV